MPDESGRNDENAKQHSKRIWSNAWKKRYPSWPKKEIYTPYTPKKEIYLGKMVTPLSRKTMEIRPRPALKMRRKSSVEKARIEQRVLHSRKKTQRQSSYIATARKKISSEQAETHRSCPADNWSESLPNARGLGQGRAGYTDLCNWLCIQLYDCF